MAAAIDIATLRARLVADTRQFSAGMAAANKQTKAATGSMKRAGKASSGFSAKAAKLGRVMRGPALAAVAVGLASVKMGVEFEDSMSKIERLVGVSGKQVDKWKKSILELGPKVGRSPKELADAMFFITSAGLRGKKALDVLEASAKASAAGLGETKEVADAVTSAMNAYGPQVVSASKATDVLTGTVKAGKLEASELAPALGKVLPVASELGVSFEDVGGAVAALSLKGLNASEAVTGLRGIMNKLIKPTSQGKEALEKVGLSADDLRKSVKTKGLLATLVDMKKKFGGNSEQIGKVFEDVEALNAVLSLTNDGGKEAAGVFEKVSDSADLTEEAFRKAAETLKFKLRQALAFAQAMMTRLGVVVIPLILKAIKELGRLFRKHKGDIEEFAKDAGEAIEAFGKIMKAIWPLVKGVLTVIIGQFQGFAKIVGGVLKIISGILTGDFGKAWEGVKQIFEGAVKSVTSLLKGLLQPFKAIGGQLKALLVSAFEGMRSRVLAVWRDARDKIKAIGSQIVNFFRGLPGRVKNALSGIGSVLIGRGKSLIRGLRDGVGTAWGGLKEWFQGLPGLAKKAIGNVASTLAGKGKSLLQGLWDGLRDWWTDKITDKFKGIPGEIVEAIKKGISDAGSSIADLGASIGDKIVEGLGSIKNLAKRTYNQMADFINSETIFGDRIEVKFPVIGKKGVNIPKFPRLARGGVAAEGLSMVGERGPELAALPRGTRVFSRAQTADLLRASSLEPRAAGATTNITVHQSFLVPDEATAKRVAIMATERLAFQLSAA